MRQACQLYLGSSLALLFSDTKMIASMHDIFGLKSNWVEENSLFLSQNSFFFPKISQKKFPVELNKLLGL